MPKDADYLANLEDRIRRLETRSAPAASGSFKSARAGWYTSGPGASPADMDPQSFFNHSLWYPWFGELRDSSGGFSLCTSGVTPNIGSHQYGMQVDESGLYIVQWRGKLEMSFGSAQSEIHFEPRIRLESNPTDGFSFEIGYLSGDRIKRGSGSSQTISCDVIGLVPLEAEGKIIPYVYCEGDSSTDPTSAHFWGTYNDVSFGTELLATRVGDSDGILFT